MEEAESKQENKEEEIFLMHQGHKIVLEPEEEPEYIDIHQFLHIYDDFLEGKK